MKYLRIAWVIIVVAICIAAISFEAKAAPTGPSSAISPLSSSRYGTAVSQSTAAQAGNVSEFNLNADTITNTWQGYFGNITGRIVLGNAANQSFYDWTLSSPQGEIYATRTSSTPAWSSVRCANTTEVNAEDTALGVNQTRDMDSVNRTFLNTTSFTNFYVGGVFINSSNNCHATRTYNSIGQPSSSFAEVLLTDTSSTIYTGLLAQDALGFDNRTHDFQILVGENGHLGDTSTTTYYFYLELE